MLKPVLQILQRGHIEEVPKHAIKVCNFSNDAKFSVKACKLFKLEEGPKTEVTITREKSLEMLKQMMMMRRLETWAGNLYKEKYIRGFCHLYSGQEACAVGIKHAMRSQDCVISGYRVHGWPYLQGDTPRSILSELTGREAGMCRGKGGSMHMFGPNFYGGHGIVGAQVPLGAGIAFANKYKENGGVCFAMYGDGASNQGQVFEAYNIAKLLALPCIFVCENNGYGMGTSSARSSSNTNYFSRGDYVPGIQVDGMDVLAVKSASEFAIEHCTTGKGPIIMENVTYRYSGHSMSDPGTSYRTRDEVQAMRQTKDPISMLKEKLLSTDLASQEDFKKIESEVKTAVEKAAKHAKEDKDAGLEELSADVFAKCLEGAFRGVSATDTWPHKNIGKPINVD